MSNQESFNTSELVVYKASAGSGKTHQLTGEYLSLLFSSPFAYKHILAVTFTNKATEEMKSRIIEELSNLASGNKSDYLDQLSAKFSKSEDGIRALARKILISILHDYSSFSISTIDRFFQQTMRAFTRELGVGGGYNVELDTSKVLGEAIDTLLFELERSENDHLLNWLVRFSEEKIENGDSWNIRSDIQSLSVEIFKESYKAHSDDIQSQISDKGLLDDYKIMLVNYIFRFEKRSKQIAVRALDLISRYNLRPDSFKGGARSPFLSFVKWAEGEVKEPTQSFLKLADCVTEWYTKTTEESIKSAISEAFDNGLNECVCDIIAHYRDSINYCSAYEINRFFFTLGILGDVDKKIRSYASDNNVMLISDTTELLNKVIQGTDAPFIYEKVGTRLDHYMIDEFQDTSGMQWQNFLPLLRNSMSSGKRNLIVGDVKQSIYRWRNSDWKLLDEQIDFDFKSNNVEHKSLDINWRSMPNVVNFNNYIFHHAPIILQELYNSGLNDVFSDYSSHPLSSKITRAYGNAYQDISPLKEYKDQGYVKVDFIDTDEYSDWHEYVMENLPAEIESLQDRGYALKDIAILVRTKKEGSEVVSCLLKHKSKNAGSHYRYDVVSDEALYLSNSSSIKLIVSLFKYIRNHTDDTLKSLAVYEYYKYKYRLSADEALKNHFSVSADFPEEVSASFNRIGELPLYEMTEELIDLFNEAIQYDEQIYVQSFLDLVLDFTTKKSSDLDSFLLWWDDNHEKLTVFTPDEQDAIRIMTIHKSKGLGFKALVIPFCSWKIDHDPTKPVILWCQPQIEPFSLLKLVPVKYSANLKNTIFYDAYFDERLHAFVDNLNLLYVAFTRAKENLIVFAPKPKEKSKLDSVPSLLWQALQRESTQFEGKQLIDTKDFFDANDSVFELGTSFSVTQKSISGLPKDHEVPLSSVSGIPFEERLKLRLSNKSLSKSNDERLYGTLLHEILSKVNILDELEITVQSYVLQGYITNSDSVAINNILYTYLSHPDVFPWYSGYYQVMNEVQILLPDGTFIRPDRVMIKDDFIVVVDYKFGEKQENVHKRQMNKYISHIRKMGYDRVTGYLCYVTLSKVIKVL